MFRFFDDEIYNSFSFESNLKLKPRDPGGYLHFESLSPLMGCISKSLNQTESAIQKTILFCPPLAISTPTISTTIAPLLLSHLSLRSACLGFRLPPAAAPPPPSPLDPPPAAPPRASSADPVELRFGVCSPTPPPRRLGLAESGRAPRGECRSRVWGLWLVHEKGTGVRTAWRWRRRGGTRPRWTRSCCSCRSSRLARSGRTPPLLRRSTRSGSHAPRHPSW